MADVEQPEPDAVDEARARAQLPVRFRGDVEGDDVEVLATVYPEEGAVLRVRVLERVERPYDQVRPKGTYSVAEPTAIDALEDARGLASDYGLEEVGEE